MRIHLHPLLVSLAIYSIVLLFYLFHLLKGGDLVIWMVWVDLGLVNLLAVLGMRSGAEVLI